MSGKHKKKKSGEHPPSHERWVVSYADLLTLLLATFVVLYASSVRNKLKEEQVAEAFLKAFHGSPSSFIVMTPSGSAGVLQHNVSPVLRPEIAPGSKMPQKPESKTAQKIDQQINKDIKNLHDLSLQLQTIFQPQIAKHQLSINNTPLTLSISLNDAVLFPSGQTTLKPDAVALLTKIAAGLIRLPPSYHIIVRGYTDNQPISTPQFPSNWSLSVERSVAVVELFIKNGIKGNVLGAAGFGQYDPIASNATAAGRYQNRRVVITVLAPAPNTGDRKDQQNQSVFTNFKG